MSETPKAGFVIKAASAAGQVMWIGPSVAGHRAFGDRSSAHVFTTQSEAHSVIGEIPLAFDRAGFVFSVEAAD
jgi:acetyl/propionyl-CoA carboxylase alpha subunit